VEKQPPKTKLPFQAFPIFLNFLWFVFKKKRERKKKEHIISLFLA